MDINKILDKLKDVISKEIGEKTVLEKDVAKFLGMTPNALAQFKHRNTVPYEQIMYFCAKRKLSINWILFEQIPDSLVDYSLDYLKVKYFKNINSGAGGGALNVNEEYEKLLISRSFLASCYKNNTHKTNQLGALHVIGDSMEPTLQTNDLVLFEMKVEKIKENSIYIVRVDEGLYIKRIRQKKNKEIALVSDNSIYLPILIDKHKIEEIEVMGRVLGKIEINNYL